MNRQYYVVYTADFANCYNLYWADSPEMIANLPDNAERITRKEAFSRCTRERKRRKYDQAFSGFADVRIYPAIDPKYNIYWDKFISFCNMIDTYIVPDTDSDGRPAESYSRR